jgi:hypothetical protein
LTSAITPTITVTHLSNPAQAEISATPDLIAGMPATNIDMQLEDLRREGEKLKAVICFQTPNNMDWIIDHASLQYSVGEISFESSEQLDYQTPATEAISGSICEEITFPVPVHADLSSARIKIQGLRAALNEADYCTRYLGEVQPTLTARQTGIILACDQSNQSLNLKVVSKPDSLRMDQAQNILDDFYTISDTWTFPFGNPPVFTFEPLDYGVKANASNFHHEGESVQFDMCLQINNSDWDAWLVQEGILKYMGQKDLYFGTSAQLRRVSPANAHFGLYCGVVQGLPGFIQLPANANKSDFTFTIASLIPDINPGNLCTTYLGHLQKRLVEQGIDLQLQCESTASGTYTLQASEIPLSLGLSDAAIERVLANVALFLYLQGSWTLDFKS